MKMIIFREDEHFINTESNTTFKKIIDFFVSIWSKHKFQD